MKAALIAVGTELVGDGRPDTNGVVLGRILASRGVETAARILVPDDEEEIARWLGDTARRFPLVVVTGGLGPTVDDVTREAAARAFGLALRQDAAVLEAVRRRHEARGRAIGPAAARQALVPEGAEVLPNAAGTAPGLLLRPPRGGIVVLLPGVPHEMERMMREQVLPRLEAEAARRADPAGVPIAFKGLKVAGLSEVEVQGRIEGLFEPGGASPGGGAAPALTLLASPGEVTVIVRGRDASQVGSVHSEARARLGEHVFSEDPDEGVETVVGRLLLARGLRLSVAESCTGGLLGALITRVPGSSGWFLQGWVTYSDAAKTAMLGVEESLLAARGAVSAEVAEAMASAARRLSGSDVALAITGVAGPEGGTPEKPVGLVYTGLASSDAARAERHLFGGDREAIRLFAARAALNRLRLALIKASP